MMSKGISIHIGINKLCIGTYNTEDPLNAPSNDAKAMADIAIHEGYSHIHLLINQEATKDRFLEIFDETIHALCDGDTLLITFSGHGGQIDDTDGDEADGKDEVWCFYDNPLKDDDLREKWPLFQKGVRIIVISSYPFIEVTVINSSKDNALMSKEMLMDKTKISNALR